MKNTDTLPQNYAYLWSVDLQKDKKIALIVNLLGAVVMAAMVYFGHRMVPIGMLFDMTAGMGAYLWRWGTLLVASVAYILLHELVHGIAMKCCGAGKIRYGFTGLYAFAGCDRYFERKSYIFIALAPVVLLGAVLLVLNILVPPTWFWVVYFVQISNLAGAAGDLYVTCRFLCFPKDILVRDNGVSMTVFAPKEN